MKGKKKKLLLGGVALVLTAAIGAGIIFATRTKAEPVGVYPFDQVGMTEYWGDSQESYGPVSTDKIQSIFLSDTQTVTEILVSEGDQVTKGDLLMSFDTTLSDLALERKRLEVEKLKLQLDTAKKELTKIKNMKPMVIPTYDDNTTDTDTALGTLLSEPYKLSSQADYDGSTKEKALICWLRGDTAVDSALLEEIRQRAETFQNENAKNAAAMQPLSAAGGYVVEKLSETTVETTTEATTEPEATTEETTLPPTSEPNETTEGSNGSTYTPFTVNSYYVVFKTTSGNMSLGSKTLWQGLWVYASGGDWKFKFFDAVTTPDHMAAQEEDGGSTGEEDAPQIDFGSGYTAAQIAQMRSEQEKKISELEFQIKMADADYKIAKTEMEDGNIYAEFDGIVASVLTEDEARNQGLPVLKVSGGGGFYIEGSVSELDRDSMEIGQEVTVNDWNTGMTYTGTVIAIGDFPSQDDSWNGSGNPNVTYYPLTVFVDETAELQEGRYASIIFSAASSQNGIYLRNPFLRSAQGKSYVYVQGADGKLKKQEVTTGKSLWGSYTEILSGLTEEDLIAFPYGKTVKEGAATAEGDVSDLYR